MTDAGLRHLLGRLGVVEEAVRALVVARRAVDPAPDDAFRGLYLSDAVVDAILTGPPLAGTGRAHPRVAELEAAAVAAEAAGARVPLRAVARAFGLAPLDVELLLVAVAPDLDARFERLYGYLNDDVSQRRATVRLAFELLGVPAADAWARSRVAPDAPLVAGGLVDVEEAERPFLTRVLRVPDRVTAHLLGGTAGEPLLVDLLVPAAGPGGGGEVVEPGGGAEPAGIGRVLGRGVRLAYVRDGGDGTGFGVGAAAIRASGKEPLRVDLARVPAGTEPALLARALRRETGLRGAAVLAGPVEALLPARPETVRALAALPGPVVLVGSLPWDPGWAVEVPALVEAGALHDEARRQLWSAHLDGHPRTGDLDPVAETAQFRLGPDQIARSARAARLEAVLRGGAVTGAGLRAGARAQSAGGLARLARRVVPAVGWDDLVLPADTLDRLRDVAARARHRDRVLREWRMRPGGGRGTGVTALFTGGSGTGKTMSAEVVAADLGLDLYVVDLATVVDKYVGETEKNLERIFTEAARVNAVLLFDEADAVFGKRSEVRDAHDRYANVETAFLLQRMETFDGLAILTTNLRGNVDESFTRRLDLVVEFPAPDAAQRLALWRRCLGPALPRAGDLDLEALAREADLSGGDIRSAAVTAAYGAAATGRPVTMADLCRAVDLEYRKLGRLVDRRGDGGWSAPRTGSG